MLLCKSEILAYGNLGLPDYALMTDFRGIRIVKRYQFRDEVPRQITSMGHAKGIERDEPDVGFRGNSILYLRSIYRQCKTSRANKSDGVAKMRTTILGSREKAEIATTEDTHISEHFEIANYKLPMCK